VGSVVRTHQNFQQSNLDRSSSESNGRHFNGGCWSVAMEFAKAASARRLLRWQSTLTRPRSWVCSSCRSNSAVASRRFSSESPSLPAPPADKPYYVTTPIFYVNAGMCRMDPFQEQHLEC
jgi:hypothetical protein